jgi:hypothetical protein
MGRGIPSALFATKTSSWSWKSGQTHSKEFGPIPTKSPIFLEAGGVALWFAFPTQSKPGPLFRSGHARSPMEICFDAPLPSQLHSVKTECELNRTLGVQFFRFVRRPISCHSLRDLPAPCLLSRPACDIGHTRRLSQTLYSSHAVPFYPLTPLFPCGYLGAAQAGPPLNVEGWPFSSGPWNNSPTLAVLENNSDNQIEDL